MANQAEIDRIEESLGCFIRAEENSNRIRRMGGGNMRGPRHGSGCGGPATRYALDKASNYGRRVRAKIA